MNHISLENLKRILDQNYKIYKILNCESKSILDTQENINALALKHFFVNRSVVRLTPILSNELNGNVASKMRLRSGFNSDGDALEVSKRSKRCTTCTTGRVSKSKGTVSKSTRSYAYNDPLESNKKLKKKSSPKSTKTKNQTIKKKNYPGKKKKSQELVESLPPQAQQQRIGEQLSEVSSSLINEVRSLRKSIIVDDEHNVSIDFNKEEIITKETSLSSQNQQQQHQHLQANDTDVVTSTLSPPNSLLTKKSNDIAIDESISILRLESEPINQNGKSEIDIQVQLPSFFQSSLVPGKYKITFDLSKVDFSKAFGTPTSSEITMKNVEITNTNTTVTSVQKQKRIRKPQKRKISATDHNDDVQSGHVPNKKQKKKEKSELVKFIEGFSDDYCQSTVTNLNSNSPNHGDNNVVTNSSPGENLIMHNNSTTNLLNSETITSTTVENNLLSNTMQENNEVEGTSSSSVQVFLTNCENGEWIRTTSDQQIVTSVPSSFLQQTNTTDSVILPTVAPSATSSFQNNVDDNFVLPTDITDIERNALILAEYIENGSESLLQENTTTVFQQQQQQQQQNNEENMNLQISLLQNNYSNAQNQNLSSLEKYETRNSQISDGVTLSSRENENNDKSDQRKDDLAGATQSGKIELEKRKQNTITLHEYRQRRSNIQFSSVTESSPSKGRDMPLLDEIELDNHSYPEKNTSSDINDCPKTFDDNSNKNHTTCTLNEKESTLENKNDEMQDIDRDEDVLSLFALSPLCISEYDSDIYNSDLDETNADNMTNNNCDITFSSLNNNNENEITIKNSNEDNNGNFDSLEIDSNNKDKNQQTDMTKVPLATAGNLEIPETLKNFRIPKRIDSNPLNTISTTTAGQLISFDENLNSLNSNRSEHHQTVLSLSSSNLTSSSIELNGGRNNEIEFTPAMKRNINLLFGNLCFAFLNDSCNFKSCKYNHYLIDKSHLKNRLLHLNPNVLDTAYKFTLRNYKLFNNYFQIFSDIYATNQQEKKLKQMIADCGIYTNGHLFLRNIMDSLIKIGLTKIDAIRQIILNSLNKTNEIKDIIVELIIENDPLQFIGVLELYTNTIDYNFQIDSIIKLTEICNQTKNFELMRLNMKIIMKMPKDILMNINSNHIVEFLLMVQGCKDM